MLLQLFKKRSDGPVVKIQPAAEIPDRDPVLLPQYKHHDILGIGKPQRLEERGIKPGDLARTGIKRKT